MDDEVTVAVGPKHARLADRPAVRHASSTGSVVLGGRRVAVRRPRARTTDGREVQLASYAAFAADDQLDRVVFERMLAGLATRRHRAATEPVGQAVEQAAAADVEVGGVPPLRAPHRPRAGAVDGPRPGRARHVDARRGLLR